jgi:hypothetical protein
MKEEYHRPLMSLVAQQGNKLALSFVFVFQIGIRLATASFPAKIFKK